MATEMITLNHPSDLMKHSTLFHANTFKFQYRDFDVRFELQEDANSGLAYHISFDYPYCSTRIPQTFYPFRDQCFKKMR